MRLSFILLILLGSAACRTHTAPATVPLAPSSFVSTRLDQIDGTALWDYTNSEVQLSAESWQKKAEADLALKPGDPKASLGLVSAYVVSSRLALARLTLQRIRFETLPTNLRASYLNLDALIALGSKEDPEALKALAIKRLNQCLKLNPGDLACSLNLGFLYLRSGQGANAKKLFAQLKKSCVNCKLAREGQILASVQTGEIRNLGAELVGFAEEDEGRLDLALVLASIEGSLPKKRASALERLDTIEAGLDPDEKDLRAWILILRKHWKDPEES